MPTRAPLRAAARCFTTVSSTERWPKQYVMTGVPSNRGACLRPERVTMLKNMGRAQLLVAGAVAALTVAGGAYAFTAANSEKRYH